MRACGHFLLLMALVGTPAVAAELQIVNSSGKTIHEVYLAGVGERSWGPDRLRQKQPNVITRGETYALLDLAPGSYQLMLVDADGSECQFDVVQVTNVHRLDLTTRRLRECTSSH